MTMRHLCPLFCDHRYNSEEKKEEDANKEHKNKLLLQKIALGTKRGREPPAETTPKEPKRQATGATNEPTRNSDLIFLGDDKDCMPLPRISNPQERPCAAFHRQGQICKRGDGCKFSHAPIDELTPESQKEWISHVRATESLSFNPKRVKSALCTLDPNRQADKKADADKG